MKKNLIILLTLIGPFACAQKSEPTAKQLNSLYWLVGTWNRTNTKPGRSATEYWEKTPANELTGKGITLRGQDTVFVEKFSLIAKDNALFYVADVPENKKAIYFKVTEASSTGFVCENPEHDFPKKITYELTGNKLKAQISGDGKAIDFLFEKIK
jgi:hypothetical protein